MIEIIKGDITKMEVDAVVNAANTSLLGGGGVDGAIHRAGGPAILDECRKIVARQGGCKVGEAVITAAGNLPARHVIHTVGPVWNGGKKKEAELLASAYRNSLQLAVEHSLRTIAFPNISTGVYRFPKPLAAEIALSTVQSFTVGFERIVFVCFDDENYDLYNRSLFAP
ncbi:MAG: O-acetyl-ADP-ribose deacetylase [Sphingobacteriales bacterium SCN 48-20]|uniref:O-acetyl-ADP-ribose deacetylase n=1 Tax=Terrimonas ferruginea TaxID=249 RepID=UPI00086C20E8|nr:O-acetyl-ADP-ribose deacetylase [Terrimonas ferruginea]MBN8785198.1 O-acetyl-ADP-ribose deacetylase [Terrimonas ferruginea]ODT90457.1 MAG: O-acetyl-ADP-ribose deacetylase [Sphingobacteriales bacterium SCN 48-20]OJW41208.1 MAG: O-acetyl-ADP-ribose deacetylase [Sphingobacteriales bacterium 48-107]